MTCPWTRYGKRLAPKSWLQTKNVNLPGLGLESSAFRPGRMSTGHMDNKKGAISTGRLRLKGRRANNRLLDGDGCLSRHRRCVPVLVPPASPWSGVFC